MKENAIRYALTRRDARVASCSHYSSEYPDRYKEHHPDGVSDWLDQASSRAEQIHAYSHIREIGTTD